MRPAEEVVRRLRSSAGWQICSACSYWQCCHEGVLLGYLQRGGTPCASHGLEAETYTCGPEIAASSYIKNRHDSLSIAQKRFKSNRFCRGKNRKVTCMALKEYYCMQVSLMN